MALIVRDRVLETCSTSGLVDFTLTGAVTGYQRFSAIGNGNKTYYTAYTVGGSEWEVGIGTVGTSSLSRDTVLSSSTGSKINFSSSPVVWCDLPASKAVFYDTNNNVTVNSIFEGFTTVTASGSQINLTAASSPYYFVTGSGGQIIKLPDATTLPIGTVFDFNNNQSSGAITVNNNSGTLVASIPSGGYTSVILYSNSNAAGTWDRHDQAPSNVSWSTNTFDYPGSITSATWNGSTIAYNRGGTGQSSPFIAGGIVYGSSTSAMAVTPIGTTGQVLTSQGASAPTWTTPTTGTVTSVAATVPSFLSVSGSPITSSGTLAISYSGTALPVANGGTGATTLTGYVFGNGTGAMTASSTIPTTALSGNYVSTFSGGTTGLLPSSSTAGAITLSGTLAVANGGTGLTSTPANGQIDIGNGTGFTRATLTAGTNIAISNTAGAITISTTGTAAGVDQTDIGTRANQIPLNQYLGTMAWQDAKAVQIAGGSIANPVITRQYNIQPTITTISAAGSTTLTIAQLLTTIVQVTQSAAVTLVLPTGTLSDAGVLNGLSAVNTSFFWAIINTGSVLGAITMTAGTGHTYVGSATVAIGTSAQFQTVKTAANTFVTYRIA